MSSKVRRISFNSKAKFRIITGMNTATFDRSRDIIIINIKECTFIVKGL